MTATTSITTALITTVTILENRKSTKAIMAIIMAGRREKEIHTEADSTLCNSKKPHTLSMGLFNSGIIIKLLQDKRFQELGIKITGTKLFILHQLQVKRYRGFNAF